VSRAHNLFEQRVLLFSVFILSLCGITYELVLGSLATYLLGNPVQQYSITIGFFLSSMGLGSFISRYMVKDILRTFIMVEVILGLFGGVSVIVLSFLFTFSAAYYILHIFFLVFIGMLVGLEIPLLTRILRKYGELKDVLSNVLSIDYIGGLAGSLLFPLVLFPFLGRMLTSIIIGLANIAVAMVLIIRLDYPGKRRADLVLPAAALIALCFLAFNSDSIMNIFQKRLYYDDIVFSRRSKVQEIVLTRNGGDFRMYLDGSLQFSSTDEYRYHEMLVLPALLSAAARPGRVLVLGGGDGLAVREVLKSGLADSVTLVDLDPVILNLARRNPSMKMLNGDSLNDPRVEVRAQDAYAFLLDNRSPYDVIIADFPDPHDETISKLYTREFYLLVSRSLKKGGLFVTQSTSPLFAREAFWCINVTLRNVFRSVIPYHLYVPTFGDWGFNLASRDEYDPAGTREPLAGCRYYSKNAFLSSLDFSADTSAVDTGINTFNRPVLYTYYLKGWKHYEDY
jgi:spermidine synthase